MLDIAKFKKQNTTILKARLNGNKFESEDEKQAILSILKLRGFDTAPWEAVGSELDTAADAAYDRICESEDRNKIKKLAKLIDDGAGRARDFEELSEEEKKEIIKISKLPAVIEDPSPKETSEKKDPKKEEILLPFTEEQQEIVDLELTKAERVRQLFDTGCSVKQISKNTGWDYVNAYDTIKAYLKKKAKLAEEASE